MNLASDSLTSQFPHELRSRRIKGYKINLNGIKMPSRQAISLSGYGTQIRRVRSQQFVITRCQSAATGQEAFELCQLR